MGTGLTLSEQSTGNANGLGPREGTEPAKDLPASHGRIGNSMAESGVAVTQDTAISTHRHNMEQLGLQAIVCRTRAHADGRTSPTPVPGTTGRETPFGVWVEPPSAKYDRLAFRPPQGAFVLDVDRKGDVDGLATIGAAEVELGFLPDTQRLTSRGVSQPSGRLLFRAPDDVIPLIERWLFTTYGPGVDVVRTGHRFSMAPGDLNPNTGGSVVVCYSPTGQPEDMWKVSDWPELPDEWVQAVRDFADQEKADGGMPGSRKVITPSEAKGLVERALERVTSHDSANPGQPFRTDLLNAAKTLGGVVGELYTETDVQELLTHAVRQVFDEPDDGDLKLIEDGLSYGYREPFEVNEGADFLDGWSDDGHGELEVYDLFAQTPVLSLLRDFAYSRKASPYMVLVLVLGRVLAEIGPKTQLPGKTFGPSAALNLCIAAVGPPGSGKSAAMELSEEFLFGRDGSPQQTHEVPLGSPQGVAAEFVRWDTERSKYVVRQDPRCIFVVDEIGTFKASASQPGSGIAATLRTMSTGGVLGARNATAENNRIVPRKSYRSVVFFGVQPLASDALLSEEEIGLGTPQRFVWELAEDNTIPRFAAEAEPLGWEPPSDLPEVIDYPADVEAEIDEWHWRKVTGDVPDALAGHLYLTRLKVAAAFSVLHGETAITRQFWELAGKIMQRSTEAQRYCAAEMSRAASKRRTSKAESEGKAKVVEARTVASETDRWDKAVEWVLSHVREAGDEGALRSDLRITMRSTNRDLFDPAVRHLIERGDLRMIKTNRQGSGRTGERLRLA